MDIKFGLDQALIDAVTNIVNESCGGKKKMEKEELHPNQVKLDKNKNGKLDSDDFKKLRKEEAEELDEVDMSTLNHLASHPMAGAMVGAAGAAAGTAIAHGIKKTVDYLNKKKAAKQFAKEEVEELDELSKDTLKSYVHKAATDIGFRGMDVGRSTSNNKDELDARSKNFKKMSKRVNGIDKAAEKLTKEQVEEIETLAAKHGLGE